MDVVGLLYVSLRIGFVQLHDGLGSRRAWAAKEMVSVVKMATWIEECTEEQRAVVPFWSQKDFMKRLLINKLFLFM
jgi:hypothetical protein